MGVSNQIENNIKDKLGPHLIVIQPQLLVVINYSYLSTKQFAGWTLEWNYKLNMPFEWLKERRSKEMEEEMLSRVIGIMKAIHLSGTVNWKLTNPTIKNIREWELPPSQKASFLWNVNLEGLRDDCFYLFIYCWSERSITIIERMDKPGYENISIVFRVNIFLWSFVVYFIFNKALSFFFCEYSGGMFWS